MVLVAIAGGSSPTLGRSIITAILQAGHHEPIILSRSKPGSEPGPPSKYGATIRYIDYTSVSSLTEGLRGVHTVISVIVVVEPSEMLAHHANLLQAAVAAGCQRFAPSEWEGGPLGQQNVDAIRGKREIWANCQQQSGLECTRFVPGWFLNYLDQGEPPPRKRDEALAGLEDDFALDYINIAAGKVTVPLTAGGEPARLTFTEIGDIGRFVAAALDLEPGKWQPDMGMVGSTVSLEEIARVAETATGKKFEIRYITKAELKQRQEGWDQQMSQGGEGVASPVFQGKLVTQLLQCVCEDEVGNQIVDPVLNRLFPDVKPVGYEEYIERFWAREDA